MSATTPASFAPRRSGADIEHGTTFTPRFDADGLIPAIVSDVASGAVLMFAFMNAEALARTIATGQAHFWSRSRNKLWIKGEESGNSLAVAEMRTDCDQDVVWLRVTVAGNGVTCHTGATSCFYRQIPPHQSDPANVMLAPISGPGHAATAGTLKE